MGAYIPMEQPWSLYNKIEKLRIDDLKTEQVRIILLAIPTARMVEWYACREGDLHWHAITELPEFYEDVRAIKGVSVTEPAKQRRATDVKAQRRPLFEEAPAELLVTDPQLSVVSTQTKERRSARRYARELQFEVSGDGQTFATNTTDISMNGISLNGELPAWVPKNFRARLGHNGAFIQILCSRVSGSKIKLKEAESWDMIRQWIVNW